MSEVRDNAAESRFEMDVNGELAIADYRKTGNVVTFTHTEVPTELRGGGVGGKLVRGALEMARERGLKVRPMCPFVADYIEKNPEFSELVQTGT